MPLKFMPYQEAMSVIGVVIMVIMVSTCGWAVSTETAAVTARIRPSIQYTGSQIQPEDIAAMAALGGCTVMSGETETREYALSGFDSIVAGVTPYVVIDGETEVKIWFEDVPFDNLARWIGILQSRYGVSVSGAEIERRSSPGLVNARLSLVRP